MTKTVLVVEDDDHKIDAIRTLIRKISSNVNLTIKRSTREGVVAVKNACYDAIVLDLSLPTFDQTASASGGEPQSQGGFEVLRMLKYLDRRPKILVVSQYHEAEIDGEYIPLHDVISILNIRYNSDVKAVSIYEMDSETWQSEFESQFRSIL